MTSDKPTDEEKQIGLSKQDQSQSTLLSNTFILYDLESQASSVIVIDDNEKKTSKIVINSLILFTFTIDVLYLYVI